MSGDGLTALIVLGPFAIFVIIMLWYQFHPVKIEGAERTRSLVTTLAVAQGLEPYEFEQLIGALFRDLGYEVEPTRYVADGGVDLILKKDNRTELVQCKRYKGNVSVQVVREFFGVMIARGVTKGYVVTTGHFTKSAEGFAQGKGMHLIDGPELAEMLEVNRKKNQL